MDNQQKINTLLDAQLQFGASRSKMAALLGVTPSALDHYRAGRRSLPGPAIQLIHILRLLDHEQRSEIIHKVTDEHGLPLDDIAD